MSFDDKINAYFVTTSQNNEKAEQMANALALLGNHIPAESIREIRASEGFPLIASGKLTKKDVFIFDQFEGDFFQQLQQTKSLIIGPSCLTSCLISCKPIPLGTSPVYTTAMRDLQISATGITPQEKERLRVLIQWMGGHYFHSFGRSITHLISNTIKSTKYEHATLNGIPVMHVDWVQRVWERSSVVDNVQATDEEFNKYNLPIFFGTNITCTGLDTDKKNEVMRLVNENGGTFHRAFRSQLVDIVITEKDKTNTDKYQAAVRYKKDILLPEWIFDSVQKGFALPTKPYHVKSLKVSTPTKTDQSIADFTANDNTQMSDISRISITGHKRQQNMSTVNDTICSTMNETMQKPNTFIAPAPPSKDLKREVLKKASGDAHYRIILEDISPREAKRAGTFLDGCCIYLSGFRAEEKEKLHRILNAGGATRYDAVHEDLTHIIVGQLDDNEFRSWKKDGLLAAVNIVRLDWLLESIKLKQPAVEVIYRCSLPTMREPDAPSPSSKKTLMSMNHSFKQPEKPIKKKLFDANNLMESESSMPVDGIPQLAPMASSTEMPLEEDEHNLIAQYSQENTPKAAVPLPIPQSANQNRTQDITVGNPVASSTHCVPNNNDSTLKSKEIGAAQQQPTDLQANPSDLTDTAMTIDYENLDCFRGVSVYVDKEHFPEEFYTQIISECEAAHGNVVPASFRDPVDYAIVSFERTLDVRRLPVKAANIVTDLYVESCIKENKLVPIEYYHKHIPDTANALPLQDMTVVTSIYAQLERDFIDSLAQLLGAKVNKAFVKKEKPLLVCPTPEGSKYQGAIKWKYPIVTSAWLVQCAEVGQKIPFDSYLVGDSANEFPASPTLRERNSNVKPLEMPPSTIPTPTTPNNIAQDFTPLRNKRVSELAGPVRTTRNSLGSAGESKTPESPHTPPNNNYARASYNFEYMEKILDEIDDPDERQCLLEVIEEMRNNQTPELERIRRQACTPINRKIPTPKGIPDFCTTPEFEKRMADEFERRWRLPTKKMKPDTPIEEIRRRVMRAHCIAMGIPFNDRDSETTTSSDPEQETQKEKKPNQPQLVRKHAQANLSPGPSTSKRFASSVADRPSPMSAADQSNGSANNTPLHHKSASRDSGIAPRAIFAHNSPITAENVSRANASDTFVPDTQSPNASNRRSTDLTGSNGSNVSGMGQRASLGKSTTINFDKLSFEETEIDGGAPTGIEKDKSNAVVVKAAGSDSSRRSSAAAAASPEVKQITEYLRNCQSRRESMKRQNALPATGAAVATASDLVAESEAHYVQPFESEQFGFGTEEMVGWRDPAEFTKSRRSKAVPLMQYQGKPRFSISCSDEQIRQTVIENILQLGGEVCQNLINFDPECTHFVCERPNRGEKMLGCISSGKWVLSLKYIEESFAKDAFIDEELYEWGNCKALNLPQLTADEQTIAQAAHRWRVQLNVGESAPAGAFTGFRAIIRISERNLDALKNVFKAGKGEVIDVKSPYAGQSAVRNATHCFVDMKKAPLQAADYKYLIDNGIQVYSQMYINGYLMNGPDVDAEKYIIRL